MQRGKEPTAPKGQLCWDGAGALRVSAGAWGWHHGDVGSRGRPGEAPGGVLQAHSAQGWRFKYPQHKCLPFTAGCRLAAVAVWSRGLCGVRGPDHGMLCAHNHRELNWGTWSTQLWCRHRGSFRPSPLGGGCVSLVLLWQHQTQKPVPQLALGWSHRGSDMLTAAAPGAWADPRAWACRPAESSTVNACSARALQSSGCPWHRAGGPQLPMDKGCWRLGTPQHVL